MWNDTDVPLAYLITFRCYGTWLHGDERGSVNRFRNQYGTRFLPPEENWKQINTDRLKAQPVILDPQMRSCVESAIRETCQKRGWHLSAINVRTNHAHIVTSAGKPSGTVLNAFKSNSTRVMRERGCWQRTTSPWADKGSTRNLWTERSVALAVDYVVSGQGGPLPEFD